MSKSRSFELRRLRLVIGFVFIFFFVLGIVTPLTGDDWTWGSQIGLNRLANGYVGYNGRLLSNTLEILITRVAIIRISLFAIVCTLLVYLTVRVAVAQSARPWHYLLAGGLFMSISTAVYAQSFGWFAGFINYVFGMVLILCYLGWLQSASRPVHWSGWVALFILGLASALIIEHVTFYLVLLSLGASIYFRRSPAKQRVNFSYLTGLLIGSVLMFSNPVYVQIFSGHNSLRHTAQNGVLQQALTMYTNQMAKYVFQQNGILLFLLCSGLILLAYQTGRGNQLIKGLISFLLLAYAGFAAFIRNFFPAANFDLVRINQLLAVASVVFIIALVVLITGYLDNVQLKRRLWLYIISALLLSAPFVVITPYGPRCAFNTITFMIIATVDVINVAVQQKALPVNATSWFKLFGTFSMMLILVAMVFNGFVNQSRPASIKKQLTAGNNIVYVRKLPFEQFLWDSSPRTTRFQYTMYKRRMGISTEQKLVFVPYDQWYKIKNR
ncbi:DUF6056 family protein [Lactiplantibacillus plajomi]|uniref:DUF6056 family protein n=1 Tax=Lactiplantibacillus plajomi TaxID=1457217 RepID=A0ABV6K238_9LACO|nr:DUF6056 family protein [Lactiplantibacillus plajomi]